MAEEKLLDPTSSEIQKKLKEIEEKSKKKERRTTNDIKLQLATRDKLERDYLEDIIEVTFKTSPSTTRTIAARRPNNEEYLELLKLGLQASKFSNTLDESAIDELSKIMKRLGSIAASLSVDKSLDEEFWNKRISSMALQNFINSLMVVSQQGFNISEEEFKSFR